MFFCQHCPSTCHDTPLTTNPSSPENPVASAAGALFNIPSLALALFRAIAPHHYGKHDCGTIYLHNDALYLADRLSSHATATLQLANDASSLGAFASRCFSAEVALQRTILRDLLAGDGTSLAAQDEETLLASIDAAIARIRALAASWTPILARSAWTLAIGALVECLAKRLVDDVLDAPAIGQDDAYRIARAISLITALDDLFLPSGPSPSPSTSPRLSPNDVPLTARFAPSWLRLKYLSEIMQANLADVRFLWFESGLSLSFSADEVVDLVGLSFEDNERSRAVVRDIKKTPRPME